MILSAVDIGKGSIARCCMQGRFSGRLQSKADEAGLLNECPQLGPLLGGSLNPEVHACVFACALLFTYQQHNKDACAHASQRRGVQIYQYWCSTSGTAHAACCTRISSRTPHLRLCCYTCMLCAPAHSLPAHSVWPCSQDSGRDAALDSLSAIVRGMASGHVRRYLEAQEAHWEVTCVPAVTVCS